MYYVNYSCNKLFFKKIFLCKNLLANVFSMFFIFENAKRGVDNTVPEN